MKTQVTEVFFWQKVLDYFWPDYCGFFAPAKLHVEVRKCGLFGCETRRGGLLFLFTSSPLTAVITFSTYTNSRSSSTATRSFETGRVRRTEQIDEERKSFIFIFIFICISSSSSSGTLLSVPVKIFSFILSAVYHLPLSQILTITPKPNLP
ncbi:hypothetical protein BGX38DRAFT_403967 [Terfezia claveryi]|nr:hypothetical protein BGX38DRAFT_403967 [Terfezia claveryi]